MKKILFISIGCFFILTAPAFAAVCYQGRCVTDSADTVPIAYSVHGKGDITLIFVHGWSGDSRYWQNQVPFFSKKYQVVTIDLAGHGQSGLTRKEYTWLAFGQDIKSVIDAIGAKKVILIGHSMSGTLIAQASLLMPDKVLGIIPIDTLQNVEPSFTAEQYEEMLKPFQADFRAAASGFIKTMFLKDADQNLVEWVAADVASAPPETALNIFKYLFSGHIAGDEAQLFDQVTVPVRCINAQLWPTDESANRRHIKDYGVTYIDGVGHFPMLESPKEFNRLLDATIKALLKK